MAGTGFFTSVAGTCVLGIQYIIMVENYYISATLLTFGILLWLFLTYTIFTTLTTQQNKPTLDKGITGGWLTAIVATQSVSILSALIASHTPQPYRIEINFFALSMWLWGGMFYIWMISLIFYRYTFLNFLPVTLHLLIGSIWGQWPFLPWVVLCLLLMLPMPLFLNHCFLF